MFDISSLVTTGGLLGLFVLMASGSSLMLGLFIPGDAINFVAGLLASQNIFPHLSIVIIVLIAGSVVGDSIGYFFGRKFGERVLNRFTNDSHHAKMIRKTRKFLEKNGTKTIALSRFIPTMGTFMPFMSGALKIKFRTFLAYDIPGITFWVTSLALIGFYLGSRFPHIYRYFIYIIFAIVLIPAIPQIFHYLKKKIERKR